MKQVSKSVLHAMVVVVAGWGLLTAGCGDEPSGEITSDMIHFGDGKQPVIAFEALEWQIGNIAEGTTLNHTFAFSNTGNAPLVIADVSGSCGCTVARDWPRSPLAPGANAEIQVTYNSRGREGNIDSEIAVVANTYPSTTTLKLTGRVLGPDDTNVTLK